MNDTEKQMAIGSAILSLIFDIPLIALIGIWLVILICSIGNKKVFINILKAMALATIVWVIGIVLAYYIIY